MKLRLESSGAKLRSFTRGPSGDASRLVAFSVPAERFVLAAFVGDAERHLCRANE
jgi:hypothetical protein